MELDLRTASAIIALIAFNIPIAVAAVSLGRVQELNKKIGGLLKEKDPNGAATDATSYSRVAGGIGAIIVGSLFWVVSNIAIATAIVHPQDLTVMLTSVGKLFFVGTALFLPYAFNQLKSVLQ